MKQLLMAFALLIFNLNITKAASRPKLILVLSIDQFRADFITRFQSHFLPATGKKIGGFNYLLQKGAYYSHAEYGLLQNMTCPGHATILTGAYTYQSGIPNNDWFDADTQEFVYCAEDKSHQTIGSSPSNTHVGTSPKNLKTTTLGDELKNAFADSKIVSIALKDRSAIMLGGHRADLALWFDPQSFQWVSSSYYLNSKELPAWVAVINKQLKSKVGTELVWEKKLDKSINPNIHVPDSKYTKDMGKAFSHKTIIGSISTLMFPLGVTLPVELAEKALKHFKLGKGKGTDLLAISFSNHDYVGHNFGPESDEVKETTVLEDQALSRLFNYLNTDLPGGLDNVWIVLTADHGVAGNPRVLSALKIPSGILDQASIAQDMENYLINKYGKGDGKWVLEPSELNFYLNRSVLKAKKLSLEEVRSELVKHLEQRPELLKGIKHVFSGTDVRNRTLPPEQFERQILRTYYEGRSGDVIMIQDPNYIISYGATTHMSGYSYDRYVPIFLSGKPFKAGLYAQGEVVDIAPTLAFLLGIVPPASSEGRILKESLLNVR